MLSSSVAMTSKKYIVKQSIGNWIVGWSFFELFVYPSALWGRSVVYVSLLCRRHCSFCQWLGRVIDDTENDLLLSCSEYEIGDLLSYVKILPLQLIFTANVLRRCGDQRWTKDRPFTRFLCCDGYANWIWWYHGLLGSCYSAYTQRTDDVGDFPSPWLPHNTILRWSNRTLCCLTLLLPLHPPLLFRNHTLLFFIDSVSHLVFEKTIIA